MDTVERLSVGIEADLSGFERGIRNAISLLNRLPREAGQAGQRLDDKLGDSATRTTTRVAQSLEALKLKLNELTLKRDLSIDSSTIERLNREIRQTQAQMKQLRSIGFPVPPPNSLAGLRAQLNDLNRKRVLLVDTNAIARANREVVVLKRQIDRLERTGLSLPSRGGSGAGLLSMAGNAGAVGAAIALLYASGKAALGTAATYQQLDLKLQATTTTQEQFNQAQGFAQRLADRYGLSVQAVTTGYANMRAATQNTNLEGRQTDRIFAALTATSAKFNLSGEATEGVLRAITQMMGKGKISAEEMRSQLGEHLPQGLQVMARALGVSTAKLDKMMSNGELLASQVLPKFAQELAKTATGAERNATTMTGGFQRLTDQSDQFLALFIKTSGIDTFFGKLSGGVADYLKLLIEAKKQTGSFSGTIMLDPVGDKQREQFTNSDPNQRQRVFNRNRQSLRGIDAEQERILSGPDPYSEASTRRLKQLDGDKAYLLKFQKDMQRIARADTAGSGKGGKTAIDYVDKLTQLKKEYDGLLDKQEALHTFSKELTKEELKRKDVLQKQLALGDPKKYGVKPIKAPLESIKVDSSLDIFKRIQSNLKEKIESMLSEGVEMKDIPTELIDQYEVVTKKIDGAEKSTKQLEEATKRVVQVLQKVEALQLKGGGQVVRNPGDTEGDTSAFTNQTYVKGAVGISPTGDFGKSGAQISTLTNRMDVGVDRYTKQATVIDKYKAMPGFLKSIAGAFSSGAKELDASITNGFGLASASLSSNANSFLDLMDGLSSLMSDFASNVLPNVGTQFFNGLADSIREGDSGPLDKALQGIRDMLSDYLIQVGTSLTLAGGLEMLGVAIPVIGAGLALSGGQKLAVGGAMLAGGVALKATGSKKGKGYAEGGHVVGVGSATSDSIPAWLSNGEFVMKAGAVRQLGLPFLNGLNQGKMSPFAAGGQVGIMPPPPANYNTGSGLIQSPYRLAKDGYSQSGAEEIKITTTSQNRGNDIYLSQQRTIRLTRQFGRG